MQSNAPAIVETARYEVALWAQKPYTLTLIGIGIGLEWQSVQQITD
ncbi:MAG TPA: hypothetical protein VIF37_03795 [Methylobacter sp.]